MEIGVCGKPNSGKSTFFSAATLVDVAIENYPFTTIKPNVGVSYARTSCVCKALNVKCSPKKGKCVDGSRFIPIKMIDVAGLVPGAHEGRGLGNQFLNDLAGTDCLIHVVDASGKTDLEGKPAVNADPIEEVLFLEKELSFWVNDIISRNWQKIKRGDVKTVVEITTGLKISEAVVKGTIEKLGLATDKINWNDEERLLFSETIIREGKPILIAANKIDVEGADENVKKLKSRFKDKTIIPVYALGELTLRRAADKGFINYLPGDKDFEIVKSLSDEQKSALEAVRKIILKNSGVGTGVQEVINSAVFDVLDYITVYPVEDENHMTDSFGNALPDAFLVKRGSTALQAAEMIHTDIAKGFVTAIDAKSKKRIGKDYILNDKDVIKIVSK